ncbi:hypothetical protein KM043_010297 [Ampulex compressa]|nr:hypothetical protein KM043_010297 [Ampulex compressa]
MKKTLHCIFRERKPSTTETSQEEVTASTSFASFKESPKKCNLSFSFNFDFDDVNNCDSSDSETADLQIDVSEVDNYELPSKHKRETVVETSVLNEMEEEIERQLDAKAAKTNLTATNVKNILKHVITNEHVMAMVQKRLQDAEDNVVFEPKLTRAKAKELAAAQVNIPWPITSVKKAPSEVQVLIEEELPEDSSDEEYNPEQDKQSDDDREAENSTNSDVESQSSTLANVCDPHLNNRPKSPDIQYDPEGIFKIPCIPHVPTEEENIGQRTRSKLCLSETSLEQIEQAFVPPDITTDMYDWDCDIDEDWDNFLKEFTQPLTQEPIVEDDPEADPEYNILEDEETDLLDKEELRADKAVKITRKELNNLIAELFEFTDTFTNEEQEGSKKKKSLDNLNQLIDTNALHCSMADLLPVLAEPELPKLVNPEQRYLLATQFCQHIQLMAQHFTLTYMHSELHSLSQTCKQNLISLRCLSNGPNSAFNVENLLDALKLISDWENKFLEEKFCDSFERAIADEDTIKKIYLTNRWKYKPKFHPELEKLLMESKALMYPQLLPEVPFRSGSRGYTESPYLKSEEALLALGLEQFLPFVASKPKKFKSKKFQLIDAAQLITQYLMPCREPKGIVSHIRKRRSAKDLNPIKYYFQEGCAPRTIHYITLERDLRAPKDQPIHLLPLRWRTHLNNGEQKIDVMKRRYILNSYSDSANRGYHASGNNKLCNISARHPLRNPVVNMLPKILPAPANNKARDNNSSNSTAVNQNKTDLSTGTLAKLSDIPNSKKALSNDANNMSDNSIMNKHVLVKHCQLYNTITNVNEADADMPDLKEVRDDTSLITESVSSTKGLPQLRRTTPRLAKTRSAQNMKLMAQVLGNKGLSNCNALKTREKNDVDKNSEKDCVLSKVDNEDEIAELMLASTTIKKDSISRKKAKEARELENIKRLLESENPLNVERRESKFAASFLQKLHLTLESNNPEAFRGVVKLFLDYNEKIDNENRTESEISFPIASTSMDTKDPLEKNVVDKDLIMIDLYQNVCTRLQDYPELCSDFLLFLKPHQAAMINKSVEYMMLQKMSEFVNVAQIYFAKQPSRIAKMMQAITQLSSDPHTTLENVHAIMGPILKGHPLVMDLFLQALPTAKPPESLFAPHMFENLTCPLGPHDKNKIYMDDAPELYENVELLMLASQEDPYGGEHCRCSCHNADDTNLKNISEHCVSCGTRFLNGRIYLQTSEGLRPAKITFPGADAEKLEHIARVSLKTMDKFIPPAPSKQRRKSTKNDSSQDELCQKQCSSKNSPIKDNEDTEKLLMKPKRGARSPPKSGGQKRPLKRSAAVDHSDISDKKMRIPQYNASASNQSGINDSLKERTDENVLHVETIVQGASVSSASLESNLKTSKKEPIVDESVTLNNTQTTDEIGSRIDNESTTTNSKPWTRQEDMVLLQSIKKDYSESTFVMVSKTLGDRSVEQVKERCQILLSLLEKMM